MRGVGGWDEVAVTAKKAAKKSIRARMATTGEKYTEARRAELGELSSRSAEAETGWQSLTAPCTPTSTGPRWFGGWLGSKWPGSSTGSG
jgi:hypothetical protein